MGIKEGVITKRRDVVRLLEDNGFISQGGSKHELFVHPDGRMTRVARHREIADEMFKIIKKQAGLLIERSIDVLHLRIRGL